MRPAIVAALVFEIVGLGYHVTSWAHSGAKSFVGFYYFLVFNGSGCGVVPACKCNLGSKFGVGHHGSNSVGLC